MANPLGDEYLCAPYYNGYADKGEKINYPRKFLYLVARDYRINNAM
jgi:hypothetical protein